MHEVTPREILGKAWWDLTRKEAYKSTQWRCIACGVPKHQAEEYQHLEGHEVYSTDYPNGRMTYVETVPLCHYCHNFIHDGRLKSLVLSGDCTRERYLRIMDHGISILSAHGLKKVLYSGPIAPWSEWRLVLFGKEYPPKFKTYEEWMARFGGTIV